MLTGCTPTVCSLVVCNTPSMAVHDLGGVDGFGPVPVDDDAVFHADWERRVFAVTQFSQVLSGFNTDAFRHGIEREEPDRYHAGYWQRWLANAERMLVEGGVLASGALDERLGGPPPSAPAARTTDAEPHGARGNIRPLDAPPRFEIGETVRTLAAAPQTGHHRLPGYAWGQVGRVRAHHGGWIFPDTHAHGRGEHPCHVYTVAFAATDLWPDDDRNHVVCLDVFEPHLEPT